MRSEHRNRPRPRWTLPAAALAAVAGRGVAAATLVPSGPAPEPAIQSGSHEAAVDGPAAAAECGAGTYDAAADLDG